MKIRLNKFLSLCGLGSRRKVESIITSGKISINSIRISNMAVYVDPDADIVEFGRKILKPELQFQYLILNKPKGYITTTKDERGRPIVVDLIPDRFTDQGVQPVGRLDKDTEGILLFTSDGDLANRLCRPSNKIPKEYIVQIDRPLDSTDAEKIRNGLYLHQIKIKTRRSKLEILDRSKKNIKITITEGKKRQLRYTFINLGYRLNKLRRTAYGPIKLTGLKKGDYRLLKPEEIKSLKNL